MKKNKIEISYRFLDPRIPTIRSIDAIGAYCTGAVGVVCRTGAVVVVIAAGAVVARTVGVSVLVTRVVVGAIVV